MLQNYPGGSPSEGPQSPAPDLDWLLNAGGGGNIDLWPLKGASPLFSLIALPS